MAARGAEARQVSAARSRLRPGRECSTLAAVSFSAPADREPMHRRQIDMRGYLRADGLFDIEGHLLDTKSYGFDNEEN